MADGDDAPQRKLQVANARPEDSGRGLAHIPRPLMAQLGIGEGDIIEIVGKSTTPARAVAPYPEDEGLELIRIDGLQRANAGAGSGDYVDVRKAEAKPATRVVFAPAQQNLRLQGSTGALKRTFFGRPLCAGDVVATAGQQRIDPEGVPPNVAQYLRAPAYALQEIRLAVISTVPKGAADHLAGEVVWRPGTVLFDAIYDPWPTPLAAAAERAGVPVVSGLDLLLGQALSQFEQFTGVTPAPEPAMRAALFAAARAR